MKYLILFLLVTCISCAQQRSVDKPPTFPPKKGIKKPKKLPRLFNYLELGDLQKNKDSLYCWKIDNECNILDGKTTLFNYYQSSGDDNPKLVPYNYAEGECLKGKYQGI